MLFYNYVCVPLAGTEKAIELCSGTVLGWCWAKSAQFRISGWVAGNKCSCSHREQSEDFLELAGRVLWLLVRWVERVAALTVSPECQNVSVLFSFLPPPPPPKFLKITFPINFRLAYYKVKPSFITGR